ncbi:MAG: hypothetical protein D6800_10200, partial [Candidatus Zixiibacteriota bacterium]
RHGGAMAVFNRVLSLALVLSILVGCSKDRPGRAVAQDGAPRFVREFALVEGADTLGPVRLQLVRDSLFVSYSGLPAIDVCDENGARSQRINLTKPDTVFPTSFVVLDSEIVVADHVHGILAMYTREGRFLTSYDLLPDQRTHLSPFAVTEYGGVLYTADPVLHKVLAISNVDARGITEKGELVLGFPKDSAVSLGFPSAVMVTLDGRLLVGDARRGSIEVFTCDGRHIYRFDQVATARPMTPQAFDVDNVPDPELQDSTTFDPSNVRLMGRIHVVDANNGLVHVFGPLGRYIMSYPSDGRLKKPAGIAIDRSRRTIFIADPSARQVFVYQYNAT